MVIFRNQVLSRLYCKTFWKKQPKAKLDITQEQLERLVIIESIPVVRTSRNSQFFTKDLESGTVFLHLLQTCQVFVFKNKVLEFLLK